MRRSSRGLGGAPSLQVMFAAHGNYTLLDHRELGNLQFQSGGAPAGDPLGKGADAADPAYDVNDACNFINRERQVGRHRPSGATSSRRNRCRCGGVGWPSACSGARSALGNADLPGGNRIRLSPRGAKPSRMRARCESLYIDTATSC